MIQLILFCVMASGFSIVMTAMYLKSKYEKKKRADDLARENEYYIKEAKRTQVKRSYYDAKYGYS